MVHLLYKYLIIHKKVSVPGVGVFFIDRKPAKHDVENKVFQSPVLHIDFKAETAIADKDFFEFVSKEKGIDIVEAVRNLHDFAYSLKQQVSANKRVELPGMGVLIKNSMGEVSFESINVLTSYFPSTIEERYFEVARTENDIQADSFKASRKTISLYNETFASSNPKSYWWIFAIILAVIGVASILYYYYQNGTFT